MANEMIRAPEPSTAIALPDKLCRNCGATLYGKFCAECGQSVEDFHRPILSLMREIIEHTLSLDARFIKSIGMLHAQPGGIALAWSAGKRNTFASPVRFFFVITVIYFFALQLGGGKETTIIDLPSGSDVHIEIGEGMKDRPAWAPKLENWIKSALKNVHAQPAAFQEKFAEWMKHMIVLMVPVLALLLRAFYWRKDRYFIDNLIFSLHLHAGLFLLFTAGELANLVNHTFGSLTWLACILISIVYIVASTRAFYPQNFFLTLAKLLLISILYFSLLGIFTGAAIVIALSYFAPAT